MRRRQVLKAGGAAIAAPVLAQLARPLERLGEDRADRGNDLGRAVGRCNA